jgi:hypothetical protein
LKNDYDDVFSNENKQTVMANQTNEMNANESDIEFEISTELIQFYEESIRYKREKSLFNFWFIFCMFLMSYFIRSRV